MMVTILTLWCQDFYQHNVSCKHDVLLFNVTILIHLQVVANVYLDTLSSYVPLSPEYSWKIN